MPNSLRFLTTILFILIIHYICTFIASHSYSTFIRRFRRGFSPSPHRWSAQWEETPWGAELRIDSGLPYSTPTHYQLIYAAAIILKVVRLEVPVWIS
jgi:hypothetical protein